MFNDSSITGEILQDLKQNRKERDWKGKKSKSMSTSGSMARNKLLSRAYRMEHCGDFLTFAECPTGEYKKLVTANFCRDRLCPMCAWRRSRMLHAQVMKVVHKAVEQYPKMRFVFLTLTVKNCEEDKLYSTITELFDGFQRLFERKEVDKNIIGWVRTLEITYNHDKTSKDYNTYHPHFHILLGVKPEYFTNGYISQARWRALWQECMRLDYEPSVWVEAVKAKAKNKERDALDSAIVETTKYAVKDSDYLLDDEEEMDRVVGVLAIALKGRRLVGFGKLFRKLKRDLKLQDVESESADLVGNDEHTCNCPICNSTLVESVYQWHVGVQSYLKIDGR